MGSKDEEREQGVECFYIAQALFVCGPLIHFSVVTLIIFAIYGLVDLFGTKSDGLEPSV